LSFLTYHPVAVEGIDLSGRNTIYAKKMPKHFGKLQLITFISLYFHKYSFEKSTMASILVKRFTSMEAMVEKVSAKFNKLIFFDLFFYEFTDIFARVSVNF